MNRYKDKETPGLIDFISKHGYALLWSSLYVLMIILGMRFDPLVSFISSTITISAMFLVHRLVKFKLIPHMMHSHRQILYYVASFLSIILLTFTAMRIEIALFLQLVKLDYVEFPDVVTESDKIFPFVRTFFLLFASYVITTVSYLLDKAKVANEKNDRLKSEKLDMELRYLKAQINPHFLFNALNNIYSLVYMGDEHAPESILKLSEMLRYVTDECQANTISLHKEVRYMDNFIDFQLMRMEEAHNIVFDKHIESPEMKFPPMIFQPLIENCFKYARLESDKQGFIHIKIEQREKQLIFTTENSVYTTHVANSKHRDGVGLLNVRKRLQLAFGDHFQLSHEQNDHIYKLLLKIQLP